MKADPKIIREVEQLFKQWEAEVNESDYKDKTKETYIRYPQIFIRWCKDEYPLRKIEQ